MLLPRIIIPILVALALLVGYGVRTGFTKPTLTQTFSDKPGQQATFTVEGVRCRGTASLFASLYEDVPGVHAIVAYASERKAVFTFDTNIISRDQIRAIMEAPIQWQDGTSNQVFQCVAVE